MNDQITQQSADESKKGFGVAQTEKGAELPSPQNIVMIYLSRDGTMAEVQVYNKSLESVLWSSAE